MKKLSIFLLCIVLLFTFASCSNTEEQGESTKTVVTTAPTSAPTAEPTEAGPTAEPTEVPTAKPKLINVVSGKEVTADYTESGTNPAYIVDEDESTRWSGFDLGRTDPRVDLRHTVVIDLAGEYTLYEFYLSFESLTGYYQIDVSETGEDDSWTTVYTYEDYTEQHSGIEDMGDFPADTKAKFIRIIIDFPEDLEYTDSDWPYCSIYEFECLGLAEE